MSILQAFYSARAVEVYAKPSTKEVIAKLDIRNGLNKCYDEITHQVIVEEIFSVFVPKAFTPNNLTVVNGDSMYSHKEFISLITYYELIS